MVTGQVMCAPETKSWLVDAEEQSLEFIVGAGFGGGVGMICGALPALKYAQYHGGTISAYKENIFGPWSENGYDARKTCSIGVIAAGIISCAIGLLCYGYDAKNTNDKNENNIPELNNKTFIAGNIAAGIGLCGLGAYLLLNKPS